VLAAENDFPTVLEEPESYDAKPFSIVIISDPITPDKTLANKGTINPLF
jgi:hypothetical protein